MCVCVCVCVKVNVCVYSVKVVGVCGGRRLSPERVVGVFSELIGGRHDCSILMGYSYFESNQSQRILSLNARS